MQRSHQNPGHVGLAGHLIDCSQSSFTKMHPCILDLQPAEAARVCTSPSQFWSRQGNAFEFSDIR